jgi:hypothetical protein
MQESCPACTCKRPGWGSGHCDIAPRGARTWLMESMRARTLVDAMMTPITVSVRNDTAKPSWRNGRNMSHLGPTLNAGHVMSPLRSARSSSAVCRGAGQRWKSCTHCALQCGP